MCWLVGEELYGKLQSLSRRRDVASLALFYRYYHGLCSDELHSIVLPLKTFEHTNRSSIQVNHPHYILAPRLNRKFHGDSFSLECFPEKCDLDSFKKRMNVYMSHILC